MFFSSKPATIPSPSEALPGRERAMPITENHFVNRVPIDGPFAAGMQQLIVGMGCFWGAERSFWQLPGVYTTAVGYCGGHTPNPGYEEVCSGRTGHNEVVLVVFDPAKIDLQAILKAFWEGHDPTQGMRQGNDQGTQYRSGIYCSDAEQQSAAEASREAYGAALAAASLGPVTTEICLAGPFYYAEDYHQQYLAKNPGGYCGLGGTGVRCPAGLAATASA
ncbi:MAG: peptide-methionine (S)-S-oxide reductase [Gammaproteobacteria bacterium]|jgi:peptide-methionine (S)-S-oxide reductase